jgi:hypothetical protein
MLLKLINGDEVDKNVIFPISLYKGTD